MVLHLTTKPLVAIHSIEAQILRIISNSDTSGALRPFQPDYNVENRRINFVNLYRHIAFVNLVYGYDLFNALKHAHIHTRGLKGTASRKWQCHSKDQACIFIRFQSCSRFTVQHEDSLSGIWIEASVKTEGSFTLDWGT